jgi:hypothetical protein
VNTAYIVAIIALVLALALGFIGCGMAMDNDRAAREAAPWLLGPAIALLLVAVIFAGIGVDFQYT